MTHGSLFSGIGGFDLAAEWAGWTNVFQVEWNTYCQKILKKNFPDARIYSDIRDFDGTPWRGSVDVISGGFPCQPYSSAGKRLGKEDDRHLWPEMLRVIREVAPRWVVGENVRGLVNWSQGLVFEEVCADLEAAGYEVQAFVLPAASVNAPHRRDRVWFVAYAAPVSCRNGVRDEGHNAPEVQGRRLNEPVNATNASNNQLEGVGYSKRYAKEGRENEGRQFSEPSGNAWAIWPTQPPVCGRNDGISNRMDRIAALGNAVVPQLVYRIFDTINQIEQI